MQEREVSLKDMLCHTLRKWRKILIVAIACAILFGAFTAMTRISDMNNPKKVERWEAEHEVALGAYWSPIYALDRAIAENERLALQAQSDIDQLEAKKGDQEALIADMEAKIAYYNALIEDYKANIAQLKEERDSTTRYLEHLQTHRENSLLAKIDPYNANVYEVYLRVDSGYTILPDNSIQNPDPTSEIRQTYRLLINNAEFYSKMNTDLALETEVCYLTEVVSVSDYGTHSLRIRVISDNATWAQSVGEYVANAIQSKWTEVNASIAEHTLTKYNTLAYTSVDLSIYNEQESVRKEIADYETTAREMNTSILQIEVDIRDMETEIRLFRQSIKESQAIIANLPVEKQQLEQKISDYHSANLKLHAEQLALKEAPEPQYAGYTVTGILASAAKYTILGGIIGAVVAAMYFAILACMSSKVLSSQQLCHATDSEFFGFWPKKSKKLFGFVDRFIASLSESSAKKVSPDVAAEVVISNVKFACSPDAKLLVCGGAAKETLEAVAAAVKEALPDAQILCGGTLAGDPATVRGLRDCDAIILVEQLDKSDLNATVQLKERADALEKDVLGVVIG